MSTYDTVDKILFNNRTRTPTLEDLTEQVNVMAKTIISHKNQEARICALETAVLRLAVSKLFNMTNRVLDTDFIVDTARKSIVIYTIELTASRVLTGTDTASVEMFVNGASVNFIENSLTVTLALGVGITNTHRKAIIGYVPENATVHLTSNGTTTIIQCLEILL